MSAEYTIDDVRQDPGKAAKLINELLSDAQKERSRMSEFIDKTRTAEQERCEGCVTDMILVLPESDEDDHRNILLHDILKAIRALDKT